MDYFTGKAGKAAAKDATTLTERIRALKKLGRLDKGKGSVNLLGAKGQAAGGKQGAGLQQEVTYPPTLSRQSQEESELLIAHPSQESDQHGADPVMVRARSMKEIFHKTNATYRLKLAGPSNTS